jgi:dTDP-4-amino-4,6-dideoxygalactose transaminase
MASIPQCNPHASYLAQRQAIDEAVQRVLAGGRYILGAEVEAFEREFATFVGAPHALGVANGTDAVAMALRSVGVGPGDAVVTVSHTAVATTVAIRSIGATPLFVDVDPEHGLIDPEQVEALLALAKRGRLGIPLARIRAIVPVHLYGRCADMPTICGIAAAHGLKIVEDCAQAHGATLHGRPAGTWGDCASFSFYPTKNLGAFGDGGAIVARDLETIAHARLLREYGWRRRYISDIEGGNSRLDELHAATLRVKLAVLARGNAQRAAHADSYRAILNNPAVQVTPESEPGRHVYHQFVVRSRARDALRGWLAEHGIGTLVHYPCPIHQQPAYAAAKFAPLPLLCTEQWGKQVLSLPMFPELAGEAVQCVAHVVNAWCPPPR